MISIARSRPFSRLMGGMGGGVEGWGRGRPYFVDYSAIQLHALSNR